MSVTALGMIETIGLVSAIEAADAGLKAARTTTALARAFTGSFAGSPERVGMVKERVFASRKE